MCSVLNNLFYYGLAYNTDNLNGNVYINFFLLGITEFPSNLIAWWLSLKVGRRWSQSFAFFFAGLFMIFVLIAGGT